MSSGILFRGMDYSCSNGMAEYLLDLCIEKFGEVENYENHLHVQNFFKDYREMFFSGLMIVLDEDDFKERTDFLFLARLFDRVFDYAESEDSELTMEGKRKVSSIFRKLVSELEDYGDPTT